jgi:Rho GDP-dissociation inhibitor
MTDQHHHEDDDLAPTQTTGYKPGEKKSLQDYQSLDAADESLNKWKESLGLNKSASASKLFQG